MQQTEDQMSAGYIEKMGLELGTLFDALSGELTLIHWRWKQFRTLFGEKPSRLDLLNQSAPFFFRIVHDVLFEDTLLGIARLVGPPKSVGNPNLTIQRLAPLIEVLSVRNEATDRIEKAKAAAAFASDWRHRHIAHRDLDLALGTSTKLLEEATREKVEAALSALRSVLIHIEHTYCGVFPTYGGPTPWDAKSLLYVIRDGLLRERDRRERWHKGEQHDDDIKPPEAV